MSVRAARAVALCLAMLAFGPARAADVLTVCLQSNDPPLSQRGGDRPAGFALALSRLVAERLGRELRVQWFVSRDDPDADLVKEANALLSDGRCALVAEYALVADALGRPFARTAKLPPGEGITPDDRRRWIRLGALAPTRPYRFDALAVIVPERAAARHVGSLADLEGLRLGVEIATLSDAIAMRYDGGSLIEHVVHRLDARALFDGLQKGELDAAFVNLHQFDAWRLRHGGGGLAASGYLHSIGFNMGFVALDTDAPLIGAVDAVLADLQAHDQLAPLAREAGLTYLPPRTPVIRPDVQPAALTGD